jgi:hypothetical protein
MVGVGVDWEELLILSGGGDPLAEPDEPERSLASSAEGVMPTAEFNARLQEVSGTIEGVIKETAADQLAPLLVLFLAEQTDDGERVQIPVPLTPFPEGDEKRHLLYGLGEQLAGKGVPVVAAFLASEAWVKAMTPADGWRARFSGVPQPSKCPDRTEAVVLWGKTIDGRSNLAMAAIGRAANGRIKLDRWRIIESEGVPDQETAQDNLLKFLFSGYLDRLKRDAPDQR